MMKVQIVTTLVAKLQSPRQAFSSVWPAREIGQTRAFKKSPKENGLQFVEIISVINFQNIRDVILNSDIGRSALTLRQTTRMPDCATGLEPWWATRSRAFTSLPSPWNNHILRSWSPRSPIKLLNSCIAYMGAWSSSYSSRCRQEHNWSLLRDFHKVSIDLRYWMWRTLRFGLETYSSKSCLILPSFIVSYTTVVHWFSKKKSIDRPWEPMISRQ